ncbi:hypothetical protein JG687_00008103, partial [Phytophthora cactorum]
NSKKLDRPIKTKCIFLFLPKTKRLYRSARSSNISAIPSHSATSAVNTGSSSATPDTVHANKTAAKANKTSADSASGNKSPVLTIQGLLFEDAKSIDDTEAMPLAFGSKQLRTACYLRLLRIIKK